MICKVNGVYKNLRYRILYVNGETYILDLGNRIFNILFPFLIWLVPNPVYRVEEDEIVEKLKTPEVHQVNTGGVGLFGGGIAVLIANLIRPLTDYFNIQSSTIVNSVIVVVAVLLLLSLRIYLNKLNQNNINNVINLEVLSKKQLWIKPESTKYFFFIFSSYLFLLIFTVVGFYSFIKFPNVLILFSIIVFLFLLLFISSITVTVNTTEIKFKSNRIKS